jgi:hypothetical protein
MPLMMRVFVDSLSASGLIEGWAQGESQRRPLGLEFWLAGQRVGAAKAVIFRADLLQAGIGHGHYGYRCQLRPKSKAHGRLEIREIGSAAVLAEHDIPADRAIAPVRRGTKPVESLLVKAAGWTMADFTGAVPALDVEAILADLGARRFVTYLYRFLLGRWPDAHEYGHYLPHMKRGVLNGMDVVRIVLGSDEHKAKHIVPPAPFDARYPFKMLETERPDAVSPLAGLHGQAIHDWLRQAVLVDSPWTAAFMPVQFIEEEMRLLCHPPAAGTTLARIDGLPLSGPSRLGLRLSLPNHASAPVEMAMLLASHKLRDEQAAAIFAGAEAAGFTGWKILTGGGARTVLCTGNAGLRGGKLYIGTRMAAGARGCDNAWASVRELVALDGLDAARVATPAKDNVIWLAG